MATDFQRTVEMFKQAEVSAGVENKGGFKFIYVGANNQEESAVVYFRMRFEDKGGSFIGVDIGNRNTPC